MCENMPQIQNNTKIKMKKNKYKAEKGRKKNNHKKRYK